jgi:hypothetical protein
VLLVEHRRRRAAAETSLATGTAELVALVPVYFQ